MDGSEQCLVPLFIAASIFVFFLISVFKTMPMNSIEQACLFCEQWGAWKLLHCYTTKPSGETDFHLPEPYRRTLFQCRVCQLIANAHDYDLFHLYEGGYGKATYGDLEGIRKSFDRIRMLGNKSDNADRCRFVFQLVKESPATLLDVGSGIGIFPNVMQDVRWKVVVVESDPLLAQHLRILGLNTYEGAWESFQSAYKFDIITLNKVLEHTQDPVTFLAHAKQFCHEKTLVYIEVPSISAKVVGYDSQDFMIEHYWVFSPASICLLVRKAGLILIELHDLIEASGKHTIRAICKL